MNRTQIQWFAIGVPAVMLGTFEFFRHRWLEHSLPGLWGNVLGAAIVAVGVYGFMRYFAVVITSAEQELGRARAESAVLAERHRIGRDMHDSVAQSLFHLRVRLQEVDRLTVQGDVGAARQEIARLEGQVAQAYEQVRTVIADLKQRSGHEDTREALRRAAERAAEEIGLQLSLRIDSVPPLDAQAHQHLQMILTEAMTNARRHGGATAANVSAKNGELRVEDNGSGFDPRRIPADRFGLMIMEERARMLGASLRVESEPGQGAVVILTWEEARS